MNRSDEDIRRKQCYAIRIGAEGEGVSRKKGSYNVHKRVIDEQVGAKPRQQEKSLVGIGSCVNSNSKCTI